jgi:hypothetical protein
VGIFERQMIPKTIFIKFCIIFKHAAEKAAERFEAQAIDLANKVEDLNKHVNDLAQQRQRLQAENNGKEGSEGR